MVAVGLLLVSLACAAGEGVRGVPGKGAAAVRTDGLPVGTDSIVAAPVLRVGQLDGAPEYAFGQVVAVVPAPDGGFYVCDGDDVSIRRYDSAGVFMRRVGRRGAGPGEYGYCADVALGRSGALAVNDPSHGRVVLFTPSGEPDRVVESRVAPGLGGGDGVFSIDTAGRMWTRGWLAGHGESEAARPSHYVIMDAEGKRIDSLRVPAAGEGPGRGFMLCTNDGCYVAQPPDSLHAVATTGHLATAWPMAYRVAVRAPDGSIREVARDAPPVKYVVAEHAQWEAWRAYMAKQNPQYPPIAIPEFKPLLRGVRFDDVGRIWVKAQVTAEDRPIPPRKPGDLRPLLTWRERNTYDLFDVATGGYIGRVAFPYATEFMASRGNRVWLREEGESGEQLIGVHELRPAKP